MKKKRLLLLAFIFIAQNLLSLVPLTQPEPVQADHNDGFNSCVSWPCHPELEVRLSDPTVTDANITWVRAEAIGDLGLDDDYFEYDSGTLIFHDVEDDPHYHTPGGLLAPGNGNPTAPSICDYGPRNDILITNNGTGETVLINLCEDQRRAFVQVEMTGQAGDPDNPDDPGGPTTGNVEVAFNDLNNVLDRIEAAGFQECALTNNDTGETWDCFDFFADDMATINGNMLTILMLEPGNYTLTVEYEEVCISNAFNCDFEDQTSFSSESITFDIEAGETTRVVIDVAGTQEFSEENFGGEVPDGPPERPGPCGGERQNPLEFFVCPVVSALFWTIDTFYRGLILPLLISDPLEDQAAPGTPQRQLFNIWNSFRVIANVLFIVLFLVAIFGQSLSGFQALSAYDIRKILPRVVVGIIGVQFSWYIVAFMVDLFNIIGAGVRALVLAPVQSIEVGFDFDLVGAWDQMAVILGITGTAVTLLWVGGIIMGLPLILFPIVFGMVLAFLVILGRRLLILMLVVTAPVAFVLWILPNTASLFKGWWEWFWKALLVYPLIMLLIAAGELMARVNWAGTSDLGTQPGTLNAIVSLVAFFAPYFLIPLVFRFAGGLLAEVSSGFDQRKQGINQRVFGNKHIEGSWRNRRYKQQRKVKARRKDRIQVASDKAANSNSRLARGAGKTIGYINQRTGGGSWDSSAENMREARRWGAEMVGSARDEEVWGALGDYNIQTGGALTGEGTAGAVLSRGDKAKMQFALEYGISKAESDEEVQAIYNRFMYGQANSSETKRNYSGNMKQFEKEAMFKRAADFHQKEFGDYKYRDPDTQEMTKDPRRLRRFATEFNSRKSGYRDTSSQRAQYWNGLSEAGQTAQNIYTRAGGGLSGPTPAAGFSSSRISRDEKLLLREMKRARETLRDTGTTGAPGSGNRARRRATSDLAWLDNLDYSQLR